MDNINPSQVVDTMVQSGKKKATLGVKDLLIRSALSGAFLGYGTTLAFTAVNQTNIGLLGALVFPAGFAMIILLGLELVTGNFALLPAAWINGEASVKQMLSNWVWVILGHLIGSIFYAILFTLSATQFGSVDSSPMIDRIIATSESKTIGYADSGASGMGTVFVKAILCNWMVALGAIMAMTSSSTIGKIFAMWLPILIFFAQGFEHLVVNMFVIPAGMLLGADVTIPQWLVWNFAPVFVGNLIAGFLLTGLALCFTYKSKAKPAVAEKPLEKAQ